MKSPTPEKLVFLLGCQRSGTTWLANLFDSSPDTWFFMEPFSPDQAIFPEWPASTRFATGPDDGMRRLLQGEMAERLFAHKTLFARSPAASPFAMRCDRLASTAIARARRLAPLALRQRARRFDLLNLNRSDPHAPRTTKSARPRAWVIKELRLAGQIPLLLDAFPAAHFVTIVRHPAATVHSIENWFARGRLVELRADLAHYVERIADQPVGRDYKELLARCAGDRTRTLALYWRIGYETIARGLAHHPGSQLIAYEALASNPVELSQRILEAAGVPWSEQTARYAAQSSARDVADPRGITTRRDSRRHLAAWTATIPESVRCKVDEMTADSELMSLFRDFYGPDDASHGAVDECDAP